jgi:membrane protein insertase Oxa1/YidC/SpoIIIJ
MIEILKLILTNGGAFITAAIMLYILSGGIAGIVQEFRKK